MSLLDLLGGLLRPPVCLGCGRPEAWPCCAACLPPDPASPGPWRLAAVPDLALWALGTYGGAMREAVLAGKLGAQPAALAALGRRLGAALAAAGAGAGAADAPAPRRPARHRASEAGSTAVGCWWSATSSPPERPSPARPPRCAKPAPARSRRRCSPRRRVPWTASPWRRRPRLGSAGSAPATVPARPPRAAARPARHGTGNARDLVESGISPAQCGKLCS